jgi:2-succinyl-5-enolpyruvyl-6-hydroxy-3-cyclohexene-1-carboxylate synthase
MTPASAGDVALACMSAFVDQLAAYGLHHACVSPGSRSTAIALALDRHHSVSVHVHLDERAAGFFAVGLAKATGAPVAVACTSGTAAAELLPAVIEAEMSRLPIVLLTADRPPELRGRGANQTIDQRDLFGRHARAFLQADVPGERAGGDATWRTIAARAMNIASQPPPAPVHVNLPFREPLTPTGDDVRLRTGPRNPDDAAIPVSLSVEAASEADDLAGELRTVERGIVLAGGLPARPDASAVPLLAGRLGWPLLAEPISQLRRPGRALAAGQLLAGDAGFIERHRPDVVLQFGATPTTRAGQALTRSCDRLVVIESPGVPADPDRRASPALVWGSDVDPGDVAARMERRARRLDWLEAWTAADTAARRATDAVLDGWEDPFEGRLARDVGAAVADGSTLFVGSSMPIRDLDAYMAPREGVRVLANRGASGIDGLVSTALGVAAARAPTIALLGDLSLLHDVGSLLWSGRRDADLVIVVPNNDGGIVFSYLEQRRLPEHRRLFTTPHGLDLGAVATAARVPHTRIERAAEVDAAVRGSAARGGVRLIEVPVDADLNVARHAEVRAAVASALASVA